MPMPRFGIGGPGLKDCIILCLKGIGVWASLMLSCTLMENVEHKF